jgi:hypothetical protein
LFADYDVLAAIATGRPGRPPRPVVSDHAVKRFVERIRPSAAYEAAREMIERALDSAVRMRRRPGEALDLWWVPDPSFLLAVKADPSGAPTVVTVLPPEWQTSGTCQRVLGIAGGDL